MKVLSIFFFLLGQFFNSFALPIDNCTIKTQDSVIIDCVTFSNCLTEEFSSYFKLEELKGYSKQGVFLKLAVLAVKNDELILRLSMIDQSRLNLMRLQEYPYFLKLGLAKFENPILLVCTDEEKDVLGGILEKNKIVRNSKRCSKKILLESNHIDWYQSLSNRVFYNYYNISYNLKTKKLYRTITYERR
jgi:hypothetical protein